MEPKQKILIVDDERFNIEMIVDSLTPDYKTVIATNGDRKKCSKRIEKI